MQTLTEKINIEIMENELSATDWELNPLSYELYWWVWTFQAAFFRDEPIPVPVLTFEVARVDNLGSYRIGLNDWAVREQININRLHLNRPLWSILATLLHECTHVWERTYVPEKKRCRNWYHPKTFRDKIESFGIITADNGCHIGLDPKGRFVHILSQHGVSFDEIPNFNIGVKSGPVPIKAKPKVKGKSKLKKWTCGCQIARIGAREFNATCDICGNKFKIDD